MLRLANARTNTVKAVIDLGSSSEDDDGEKETEKEKGTNKMEVKVEDTNMTASEPGHVHDSLQSRFLHAPISDCTC
jgi:hypothetical protein